MKDQPCGDQPAPQLIAVAHIQTTHGRHGEVAADLLTDFPDRFHAGLSVLVGEGERRRQLRIESAWIHKTGSGRRVILKFEGVDTLTEAETFRGCAVQVTSAQRHPLSEGQVYVSDLIGCTVLDDKEIIGTVEAWDETGGVPLLRVAGSQGEILIPYTPEICCAVETDKREIRVRLPEGLRGLNSQSERGRAGRK